MVFSKVELLRHSIEELTQRERHFEAHNLSKVGVYRDGKRQYSARTNEIHGLLFVLALYQFGVVPTVAPKRLIDLGCERAKEFFTADWWQAHRTDRREFSKLKTNAKLSWLQPFQLSLMFAGLQKDEALIRTLADWPEEWMKPELQAIPFPVGLEQVYFSILNALELRDLGIDTSGIRDKRCLSLIRALESTTDSALVDGVNESLLTFSKSLGVGEIMPYEAIAIEETIILHLWRGVKGIDILPEVRDELRIHLLEVPEIK